MKHHVRLALMGCGIWLSAWGAAAVLAGPQKMGKLGHTESGAPQLQGYRIQGVICLPLKRFAFESGYGMSVSPSRKHIAVFVDRKTSMLLNGKEAQIEKQPLPLPVEPVLMNNDWYVPLVFFEKAYGARAAYQDKTRTLTVELPKKTLKIPIEEYRKE